MELFYGYQVQRVVLVGDLEAVQDGVDDWNIMNEILQMAELMAQWVKRELN